MDTKFEEIVTTKRLRPRSNTTNNNHNLRQIQDKKISRNNSNHNLRQIQDKKINRNNNTHSNTSYRNSTDSKQKDSSKKLTRRNQNEVDKFTCEIQPPMAFPQQNQYTFTLPILKIIDLNSDRDNSLSLREPLKNGQKVRLPISKMSIINGVLQTAFELTTTDVKKPKDIRDDDTKQPFFCTALGLVPANEPPKPPDPGLTPWLDKELRRNKGAVKTYFRKNPVPITSSLGQKILIEAGLGRCINPREELLQIEKHCGSRGIKLRNITSKTEAENVNKIVKRKRRKKDDYNHTYSFNAHQRVNRNVELTVGMSRKAFPLFNRCRPCSIIVEKMSDEAIAKAISDLQTEKPEITNKKKLIDMLKPSYSWISSEPIPGPSRGMETIKTPVVELYDIRLSPSKSKYFK